MHLIGRGRYAREAYPVAPRPSAGPPSTDELVKITVDDTTAGFLSGKVAAGAGMILEVLNPAGDEQLQLTSRFQILREGWSVAGPQTLLANGADFDPIPASAGGDVQCNFPSWVDVDGTTSGLLYGNWCATPGLTSGPSPVLTFRVQVSLDNGVSWKFIRDITTPTCFQGVTHNQAQAAATPMGFSFSVLIVAPANPPRVRIVYNSNEDVTLLASGAHMLTVEERALGPVFSLPNTELEP